MGALLNSIRCQGERCRSVLQAQSGAPWDSVPPAVPQCHAQSSWECGSPPKQGWVCAAPFFLARSLSPSAPSRDSGWPASVDDGLTGRDWSAAPPPWRKGLRRPIDRAAVASNAGSLFPRLLGRGSQLALPGVQVSTAVLGSGAGAGTGPVFPAGPLALASSSLLGEREKDCRHFHVASPWRVSVRRGRTGRNITCTTAGHADRRGESWAGVLFYFAARHAATPPTCQVSGPPCWLESWTVGFVRRRGRRSRRVRSTSTPATARPTLVERFRVFNLVRMRLPASRGCLRY